MIHGIRFKAPCVACSRNPPKEITPMNAKIQTSCPNCLKTFEVPKEYDGKRATCASCKSKFVVSASDSVAATTDQKVLEENAAFLPTWIVFPKEGEAIGSSPKQFEKFPPLPVPISTGNQTVTVAPTTFHETLNRVMKFDSRVWVPLAVGLASLFSGYVIGREHLKYQLRSAVQQVFRNPFSGMGADPEITSPAVNSPQEKAPLNIGQRFEIPGLALTLTNVTRGKATLKSRIGITAPGKQLSEGEHLTFTFTITNMEERKERFFYESNNFSLKDDVGNRIRGVDFGFAFAVVGAFPDGQIIPGQTVRHAAVFSLPLPKTEHMILSIDLACLEGKGDVRYMIPIDSVTKLNP